MDPVKTIFDISALAPAEGTGEHRSGVFRLVDQTARALNSHPECALKCCSLRDFPPTLDYWQQLTGCSDSEISLSPFYKRCRELLSALGPTNSHPFQGLTNALHLALDRSLRIGSRLLSPLDKRDLQDADVFHSPFRPPPQLLHKHKRLQRFLTIHDMIPTVHPEWFKPLNVWFHKKIVASIDRETWCICTTRFTRQLLCEHSNADPDRTFVIPLAADSDLFYSVPRSQSSKAILSQYGIPQEPYLLSVCTLEPRKNLAHVIDCFLRVSAEEPGFDCHLVLAGASGWLTDEDKSKLVAAGKRDRCRVIITGYVQDQDLAALYSASLAFVYMSLFEGFGLPPLEAMQCGVPVICSNTTSLPEVVGESGILLPPTDRDALCDAMLEMWKDAARREALSLRSLERARGFAWGTTADETVTAYRRALETR